jgi:hypothetical protein
MQRVGMCMEYGQSRFSPRSVLEKVEIRYNRLHVRQVDRTLRWVQVGKGLRPCRFADGVRTPSWTVTLRRARSPRRRCCGRSPVDNGAVDIVEEHERLVLVSPRAVHDVASRRQVGAPLPCMTAGAHFPHRSTGGAICPAPTMRHSTSITVGSGAVTHDLLPIEAGGQSVIDAGGRRRGIGIRTPMGRRHTAHAGPSHASADTSPAVGRTRHDYVETADDGLEAG